MNIVFSNIFEAILHFFISNSLKSRYYYLNLHQTFTDKLVGCKKDNYLYIPGIA